MPMQVDWPRPAAVVSGEVPAATLASQASQEVAKLLQDESLLNAAYPRSGTYMLLGAGYVAARIGSIEPVERVLGKIKPSDVEGFPTLAQMRVVLLSERERLEGRPQNAIDLLSPLATEEDATVPVHSALLSAAGAKGEQRIAAREAKWLASHRGRELSEEGVDNLPTPFNILDGNRARAGTTGKAGFR